MTVSWGTEERYKVEERSRGGDWQKVLQTSDIGAAFEAVRDQKALMARGLKKFPDRPEDYTRDYRVIDGRRNHIVIWPTLQYRLPPPKRTDDSDHMADALSYVMQGQTVRGLRTPTSQFTI